MLICDRCGNKTDYKNNIIVESVKFFDIRKPDTSIGLASLKSFKAELCNKCRGELYFLLEKFVKETPIRRITTITLPPKVEKKSTKRQRKRKGRPIKAEKTQLL